MGTFRHEVVILCVEDMGISPEFPHFAEATDYLALVASAAERRQKDADEHRDDADDDQQFDQCKRTGTLFVET